MLQGLRLGAEKIKQPAGHGLYSRSIAGLYCPSIFTQPFSYSEGRGHKKVSGAVSKRAQRQAIRLYYSRISENFKIR